MNSARLSELDPELDEARGDLWFMCPACRRHSIAVSWKLPSYHVNGKYLWNKTGDSVDNLTITPSINLDHLGNDCRFHGWITNGTVTW